MKMIAALETQILSLSSPKQSRLLKACRKVSDFAKSLEPFFKTVDLFVSSHPDWAAIAWGLVHLVFTVYKSSFSNVLLGHDY